MNRLLACVLTASLALGNSGFLCAKSAQRQVRVDRPRVNVRVKPMANAQVLFKLSKGETVKLIDESADWYKIEDAKGRQGYVHRSVVVLETAAPVAAAPEKRATVAQKRPVPTTGKRAIPKKALLIGGGVVLAGAAVVLATRGGDEGDDGSLKSKDDDGDGYSEEQGDCDDKQADVRPGGSIKAVLSSSIADQSVDCTTMSNWQVTVVNNSCDALTVTEVAVNSAVRGGSSDRYCFKASGKVTPATNSVPAGSTTKVHSTSYASGCCESADDCGGFCQFRDAYTVRTSAGDFTTESVDYQVNFGAQCPVCPSFRGFGGVCSKITTE